MKPDVSPPVRRWPTPRNLLLLALLPALVALVWSRSAPTATTPNPTSPRALASLPAAQRVAAHSVRPAAVAHTPLKGDKAVAQLRQEGHYDSLVEAFEAARYNVEPLKSRGRATGAFVASNPAQQLEARFQSGGVHISPTRKFLR